MDLVYMMKSSVFQFCILLLLQHGLTTMGIMQGQVTLHDRRPVRKWEEENKFHVTCF